MRSQETHLINPWMQKKETKPNTTQGW